MLTIYSASAGTGKTHTLTGEYLSLLFKGKERHRHILAVTFTNKATAEMKNRIMEELFLLADHQPSDYMTLLSENGKKDETQIRTQAKSILHNILHDYSSFHISTIDRFFQQTLRAFTREIGLQGNYQVELEPDLMLEKAVDNMLAELEKSENTTLLNWLLQFMEDSIEEASGWDIRKPIIKLSKHLFSETYQSDSAHIQVAINQKQVLSNYRDTLYQIIQSTRKTAKSFGEQGLLLIRQHGMKLSDFKNGAIRTPFRFFEKLANGDVDLPTDTFRALPDNLDGYLAKKASLQLRQAAERIYENGMNELIRSVIAFSDNLTDYLTAREIIKNFYTLGILTDLSLHIAQWRKDNNKLLIADTTELLNRIIDGSDIPFIYEKTGVHIEHYMIDEFQDTSAMQWLNFRPLLKESLDSGRSNLIVGDVKQSIYRFRNSDWKLLDRQVKIDFEKQIKEITLDVNWRSCRHIVQFNNMLFDAIPNILQQVYNGEVETSSLSTGEKEHYQTSIIDAYKNACQQVAPPLTGQDGHVNIQFLSDNDEYAWEEQSLQHLPYILEQLQDSGYALRDMAILTRTNTEGLSVAKTLLDYKETRPDAPYKYDFISEDTLTVGASLSVHWFIAMFRYLHQPDNKNYRQMAQLAYAILKMKKQTSDVVPDDMQSFNRYDQPFLPDVVVKLNQLSHLSLYELAEGLFRLFEDDFPDNELVYIQTFLDQISEYAASETGDMGRFLTWWDEKGYERRIITPDSQNAIRIMTVHKSKGLGFKVVIMPFADWKVDQKPAIMWCHPTREPFNAMYSVPVNYVKALSNTIFAADYFTEKLHAYIDNLNVLYVAFTRAKEELIVLAPKPNDQISSIAGLLWNGLLNDQQFTFDTENGLYERGSRPPQYVITNQTLPVVANSEVIRHETVVEEIPVEHLYSLSVDDRMLLRLRHQGAFLNNQKRKYGLLMHDILSGIENREDISRAVSEKQATGEINSDEAVQLKEELISLTSKKEVCHWFDGSLQVMNETDILFDNGQSVRPDRIMIDTNQNVIIVDYKFGDQKEVFHQRQIEHYSSLIRAMGYENVTGYLWYITLGEIEKYIFLN